LLLTLIGCGGATSLGHDNPHRPKSIAKPAALSLQDLSRTAALNATRYNLKVTLPDVGRSGAVLYHLCVVILSQPRRQLPLYLFAFVDTNLCRHRGPPIRNTSITDGLATVEESTGVGPLKELPAPGTAANTKQGQCTN
jgi:hypothetical protein